MTAAEDVAQAFAVLRREFPIPHYIDESAAGSMFVVSEITRLAPARGRLLDIGCGPLDKTGLFAIMGFECYACDDFLDPWHRSPGARAAIEGFASRRSIRLHVHKDGDYSIPFEKGSFDVVTLLGVIEHLHESPRDLLTTAAEMLREGGLLVVVTPNAVNVRKRIHVLFGKSNFPDVRGFYHSVGAWRGHVREYTLEEVAFVVEAAGFEVTRARTFDGMVERRVPRGFRRVYRELIRLAPKMRDSLFVAARKPAGWTEPVASEESYRIAIARAVPSALR